MQFQIKNRLKIIQKTPKSTQKRVLFLIYHLKSVYLFNLNLKPNGKNIEN